MDEKSERTINGGVDSIRRHPGLRHFSSEVEIRRRSSYIFPSTHYYWIVHWM